MKYKGRLANPYPYREAPGPLASKERVDEWINAEVVDWRSRFDELFDAHGIARDDWVMLAIRLAEAHVPGMRMEAAPRGAPDKWGVMGRAELKARVDDMIRHAAPRKLKPSSAIAYLAKHEPWKSKLAGLKNPTDALRKQYEQADERWVRVWRTALAYRIYEQDPNKDLDAAARAAGLVDGK